MAKNSDVVEKRLRATLELNSGNFAKDFKNVNALLKDSQNEVKNTAKEMKSFGENTKTLTNSLSALTRQYELQTSKAEIYRSQIEKTSKAYTENIERRRELSNTLSEANKKYEEAVTLHGKESDSAKEAANEVSKLQKEYDKTSKNLDNNQKALGRYNTGLRNTETELKLTKRAIDNTSISLEKSNNKWLQSAKAIEEYKKKVDGIYNQVNSVGNAMIKGGALIATGVTAGLKAYGEYGDSLAKVNSIAQLSVGDLNALGGEIKQISNDLVIPINVLAEAEYQALSASVEVGKSMEFLGTSSKLAKGGFTDVVKSVDVLTSVMNAYSMQTEEAARVSDILIMTQNLGKVTVGEMADKLGEVIPTAKNASVNIENLGASIAVLTSQGIKPAQAITSLNALFNEFSKSGTEVSKVLKKETGKSFGELAAEGKSVSDILLVIDKYSKKTGTSFNDLFGSVEATKGAMGLLKDEGAEYSKVLGQIQQSAGATQKAFEGVAGTDMEKARKAMNELVNSFIKLGSASVPILEEVSGAISNLADVIENTDEATLRNVAEMGKWLLIIGATTKGVAGLTKTCGSLMNVASKVTGAIGANGGVAGSMTALGTSVKATVVAINPFTAAVALLGGVGLVAWGRATEVQNERQKALNKTLEDTNNILKNGISPGEIGSYGIEIDGLDAQISELDSYQEQLKSAREERDKLFERKLVLEDSVFSGNTDNISEYTSELVGINDRIGELDNQINVWSGSMAVLNNELVNQYGNVDAAQKKLKTYKQAIADAQTQKYLLSKATNEHTKGLVDEHTSIVKSIRQVESLSDEYEELVRKEKLSADEKKRLEEIQRQLIATLGDSIIAYDSQGRAIGINIEMLNKEKLSTLGVAEAAKKRTIIAAAAGIEHVKNTKNQVSAVIKAIQLEEEALAGRASWKDPRRIDTAGMSTSERAYWEDQKGYVRNNKEEVVAYESELDNLLKKLDAINTTTTDSDDDKGKDNGSGVEEDKLRIALEAFEKRKKLNKVSINSEMSELDRIKTKYAKTTDEKIVMDEYMLNNYLSILERKKAAGEMYLDKEIQMLEKARDHYAVTESTKVDLDNQINELKLENARKYIDKKKYYNQMSLDEEKAAYERMLGYAKNNADETESINREIYRVQQEILSQEVQAVKDATAEKIKSREEEKNAQLKLIDEKLSRELSGYQAELDALDKLEEAERRREKEDEHNKKVENLQGKLTGATTDEERNAIIEEMNAENDSYAKYLRDQQRKDERDAIREKMEAARQKAQVEKDLAEENYNNFVKGLTAQQNEYIKFLEGKGTQTSGVEQGITTFLGGEYASRNLLFQQAVDKDILYLRNAATIMQGIYQSIFSMSNAGKVQLPSVPKTPGSGKSVTTTNAQTANITLNSTYNVGNMATAKAITSNQENMLNKQARNLGLKR